MFIHIYLYFTANHRGRGGPSRSWWSTVRSIPDNARGVQPLSTRSIVMERPSDRDDFPRSRKMVHGGSEVDGRNLARRSVPRALMRNRKIRPPIRNIIIVYFKQIYFMCFKELLLSTYPLARACQDRAGSPSRRCKVPCTRGCCSADTARRSRSPRPIPGPRCSSRPPDRRSARWCGCRRRHAAAGICPGSRSHGGCLKRRNTCIFVYKINNSFTALKDVATLSRA